MDGGAPEVHLLHRIILHCTATSTDREKELRLESWMIHVPTNHEHTVASLSVFSEAFLVGGEGER